jgi:hypothetical protein
MSWYEMRIPGESASAPSSSCGSYSSAADVTCSVPGRSCRACVGADAIGAVAAGSCRAQANVPHSFSPGGSTTPYSAGSRQGLTLVHFLA